METFINSILNTINIENSKVIEVPSYFLPLFGFLIINLIVFIFLPFFCFKKRSNISNSNDSDNDDSSSSDNGEEDISYDPNVDYDSEDDPNDLDYILPLDYNSDDGSTEYSDDEDTDEDDIIKPFNSLKENAKSKKYYKTIQSQINQVFTTENEKLEIKRQKQSINKYSSIAAKQKLIQSFTINKQKDIKKLNYINNNLKTSIALIKSFIFKTSKFDYLKMQQTKEHENKEINNYSITKFVESLKRKNPKLEIASQAGTYVHNFINHFNQKFIKSNDLVSKKLNAQELFDSLVDKFLKSKNDDYCNIVNEENKTLKNIWSNYVDFSKSTLKTHVLISSELDVSYNMEYSSHKNIFFGRIDAIYVESHITNPIKPGYIICDWKVTTGEYDETTFNHYEVVLNIYAYIFKQHLIKEAKAKRINNFDPVICLKVVCLGNTATSKLIVHDIMNYSDSEVSSLLEAVQQKSK